MHPLQRLHGHHLWATRLLIERCAALPPEQQELEAEGTRGGLATTLNHLLAAQGRYLAVIGHPLADPVSERAPRPVAALAEALDRAGEALAGWLAVARPERRIEVDRGKGREFLHEWVPVVQGIHHGQDHRTHVTTVLAAHGLDSTEADSWDYGDALAAGRPEAPGATAVSRAEVDGAAADALLRRAFDHNRWANRRLLEHCTTGPVAAAAGPGENPKAWTAPGTYGTIHQTLGHLVAAEQSYLRRLTGGQPVPPPGDLPAATMRAILDELDQGWPALLDDPGDPERSIPTRSGDFPAWVVLCQAVVHGHEHRANICSILGAHGQEPPDLDVWAYAASIGAIGAVAATA
jgi:uncharacterized damage-inducible protein DinB